MAQYQIEMSGVVTLNEVCDCRDDDTALREAVQKVVELNRKHRGLGGKCEIHVTDEDGNDIAEYETTWETYH